MTTEIKVPMLPESVSDATVSTWYKKVGDQVSRNENLVDLETDKVMLEVPSPVDGVLKEILKKTGATVKPSEVLAVIDEGAAAKAETSQAKGSKTKAETSQAKETKAEATKAEAIKAEATKASKSAATTPQTAATAGPSSRRAAAEHEVDLREVQGTGKQGRITKENVLSAVKNQEEGETEKEPQTGTQTEPESDDFANLTEGRPEKRVPMTRIRARIAERLLEVSQNTAMLTTFNEINLQHVIELRNHYKEVFEKKYKVKLGFMSFFVRAAAEALKRFPVVNASIDGKDIVYHGYYDIGVAVSTDRGLVVPILRDVDKMSMAEIEIQIAEYATKARAGKLSMEEMQGGTFTITNGGVFGSLMATPIVNAPQCAIFGMHKIQERPIAENGQVVIRPMMYVALSYDHRLIDGRESVTFLVTIKELLEDPSRLLLEV